MKRQLLNSKMLTTAGVLATLLLVCGNASALDAAYSRKGGFTGFGLGGGAAFFIDGNTAGDIGLDLQAGIGASDTLTVALNVDGRLQVSNDFVSGMIIPGPELSFFLTKGLYMQVGAGVALTFPDSADFTVGVDVGAAVGYEIWVNTNLAAYMSIDVDYFLINDLNDMVAVGFWLGIRYY